MQHPAVASQPAPCTHQPADPALNANPPSSCDALVLLTACPPKQSAQNTASATVALAGTTKRNRSAQAFEEDNASSSSSSRQAGSPSTSVPSDAMNRSAKRARHNSPQSNQQAELSSSGSPSPEQPVVCQCDAELPLQPDTEEEVPSDGNTEPGRLADVKEEECEVDVPVEEQGSPGDADEEEDSSLDEENAGQESAGVNTTAEEASTSGQDSGEEEDAVQQPGHASHDKRSAASASLGEVSALDDSAAASMQSDGKSNDDQQEVAADGTEETSGSDDIPQPVLDGKLSKLHWSVLLTAATGSSASAEFPSVRSLLPPAC